MSRRFTQRLYYGVILRPCPASRPTPPPPPARGPAAIRETLAALGGERDGAVPGGPAVAEGDQQPGQGAPPPRLWAAGAEEAAGAGRGRLRRKGAGGSGEVSVDAGGRVAGGEGIPSAARARSAEIALATDMSSDCSPLRPSKYRSIIFITQAHQILP